MLGIIFIGYAREDEELARRLYNDLKMRGLNPWFDKICILPGQKWKNEIEKVIKKSSFFIAVISSRSVDKRGYSQNELKQAIEVLKDNPESKIFLIPIRLDNCDPPHILEDIHWVDMFPNWELGLSRILSAIHEEIKHDLPVGKDEDLRERTIYEQESSTVDTYFARGNNDNKSEVFNEIDNKSSKIVVKMTDHADFELDTSQ